MIKQMERKFTLVAISVISLVLLVLIILVNSISIFGNIRRADDSLNRLVNQEFFDKREPKPDEDFNFDGNKPSELLPLDIQDRRDAGKEENRTFDVIMEEDLSLISTNASLKNMHDDEVAYQMAILAVEDNKKHGFVEDFRYIVIKENNQVKVIFLDYSFERQSELYFLVVSIVAYFAAIILVTILVYVLLKPVMKSIKESYAKQRQFITDASHELKTPLTVISTDMEIIEMDHGSSEWINSVNQQIVKLNRLTNELVTLSRMDEEDTQMFMSEVNLSDIVNDVVMGFEPAIDAKGKRFDVDIEDDLRLSGHHDSLERVMSVLLSNALKYSDDQGLIAVKAFKKGKKIKLIVMNSVDHLDKGNHDEFFERFYRSDASRNSQTGGFGIGLAVAKAIIEEHKGKIEAKSTNEQSLEVIIILKAL